MAGGRLLTACNMIRISGRTGPEIPRPDQGRQVIQRHHGRGAGGTHRAGRHPGRKCFDILSCWTRHKECMDSITFRSDIVLSDVHMYTPNCSHLMVRLNGDGQPVFVSKFKILHNINAYSKRDLEHLSNEETKDDDLISRIGCSSAAINEKVDKKMEDTHTGILLDDDGDLDVARKSDGVLHSDEEDQWREKVYPTIISKGEEFFSEDYEEDCSVCNELRIEHTMGTALEDVGKQVWRGAFLLADYILNNSYLFRDRTVLELGAGTGMTSIVMATVAKTIYCTGEAAA